MGTAHRSHSGAQGAYGKIPEGKWKREADRLSEEIAALRKEDNGSMPCYESMRESKIMWKL